MVWNENSRRLWATDHEVFLTELINIQQGKLYTCRQLTCIQFVIYLVTCSIILFNDHVQYNTPCLDIYIHVIRKYGMNSCNKTLFEFIHCHKIQLMLTRTKYICSNTVSTYICMHKFLHKRWYNRSTNNIDQSLLACTDIVFSHTVAS